MVGEPVILHLPWILALSRRGGALIAIGVTLAAGGIVTGGIYQPDIPLPGGGGGGATPGTANLWIDTNGGTCARSSSPVSYNTDTACASMQAAHAASVCGDTVGIAPGSYGAQSVSGSPLCSLGSEVHFISYDTTRPTFADLNFAKSSAGLIVEHVSTPGGIDMTDRLTIKDSTFKEFSAAFDATGSPDNWTLDGNDINGNGQVDQNFIWDSPSGNGATGWKIVNNTIRNFYDDVNPSDHTEGIYLGGYSDNGLIAGNTFTNNGNSSQIFVTWLATVPVLVPNLEVRIRGTSVSVTTSSTRHTAHSSISTRGMRSLRARHRVSCTTQITATQVVWISQNSMEIVARRKDEVCRYSTSRACLHVIGLCC